MVKSIEPSPVDISSSIKKIGILNSSKDSIQNEYANRLEQLIYLEEQWLSEHGANAALTGLFNELSLDKRFDTVRILEDNQAEKINFVANPDIDTWNKISKICIDNDVDAIFALVTYDTETTFSLKKTKIYQYNMLREEVKVKGQEITLETLIENGWRIYDPHHRLLLDQFSTNDQMVAIAAGENSTAAMQAINNRRELLLDQNNTAGSTYAQRLQPSELELERRYYAVGSSNFKLAHQFIEQGDFHAASELWGEEIENPKAKLSARACFNLAILKEYNNDIIAAIRWAKKSYQILQNDNTLDYIWALEQRQAQAVILDLQLANTSFDY